MVAYEMHLIFIMVKVLAKSTGILIETFFPLEMNKSFKLFNINGELCIFFEKKG